MHIMIAIPTHSGSVEIECLTSIFRLQGHLVSTRPGIRMSMSCIVGVPVDFARNVLTAKFLADPTATHLLFIDADMGFNPSLIDKMINEDKPVTAAVYPARVYDHVAASNLHNVSSEKRMSVSAQYVGSQRILHTDGKFGVSNTGFVRVAGIGTGVMLIRRKVFDAIGADNSMWTRENDRRYAKHFSSRVLEAFAPLMGADGNWLSEDLSFCQRWINTGGEVWACVDEEICHVGRIAVRGKFHDQLIHFGGLPRSVN